jgi:outer membrane protein W
VVIRLFAFVVLAAAMVSMGAGATHAAEAGDMKVRFGLTWVDPTGQSTLDRQIPRTPIDQDVAIVSADVRVEPTMGVRVGFEYLITGVVGIDFSFGFSDHDVSVDETILVGFLPAGGTIPDDLQDPQRIRRTLPDTATLAMATFTVGVYFHPLRNEQVDLWIGPQLAYTIFGNLKYAELPEPEEPDDPIEPPPDIPDTRVDTAMDADIALGAIVGVDWHIGGSGWAVSFSAQYLSIEAVPNEPASNQSIDIDPWVLNIGTAYRF